MVESGAHTVGVYEENHLSITRWPTHCPTPTRRVGDIPCSGSLPVSACCSPLQCCWPAAPRLRRHRNLYCCRPLPFRRRRRFPRPHQHRLRLSPRQHRNPRPRFRRLQSLLQQPPSPTATLAPTSPGTPDISSIGNGRYPAALGMQAPTFTLPSGNGPVIDLASYTGKKNVVLVFYRTHT